MKNIFVINGSASENSSNLKLIEFFKDLTKSFFTLKVFNDLKSLPHFDPELSVNNTPKIISDFRQDIEKADGIVISTPEYIFSIPSGLKNALEWCVSTTIFSEKPTGFITASASGQKGHEELQLILKTLSAKFTPDTSLLIQGVKGKIDGEGNINDVKTKNELEKFANAYRILVENNVPAFTS